MKRGFTLIELLVMIAIIGILSSVVLSALNKAREGDEEVPLSEQCERYADWALKDIPAKCIRFYQ